MTNEKDIEQVADELAAAFERAGKSMAQLAVEKTGSKASLESLAKRALKKNGNDLKAAADWMMRQGELKALREWMMRQRTEDPGLLGRLVKTKFGN